MGGSVVLEGNLFYQVATDGSAFSRDVVIAPGGWVNVEERISVFSGASSIAFLAEGIPIKIFTIQVLNDGKILILGEPGFNPCMDMVKPGCEILVESVESGQRFARVSSI